MAASIAKVGIQVVNVGGTEPVTTQEYCQMAGEILVRNRFSRRSKAWPTWADTTRMVELLGPNKVRFAKVCAGQSKRRRTG